MATRTVKSIEDLADHLRRIGLKLQSVANRRQRLEARIARNSTKVDADRKRLSELNRREEEAIFALAGRAYTYAESHRAELSNDSGKTVKVETGRIEWTLASSGKLVCPNGDEALVRELLKRYPALFFELVKCELRKNNVKAAIESGTASPDNAYVERGEFVRFAPANTSQALSRPVAFWRQLAARP